MRRGSIARSDGRTQHVQRATLAARLGLDQPMKRDVVRQNQVLFDVAAAASQMRMLSDLKCLEMCGVIDRGD